MFKSRLPAIVAPMFLVSGPDLVLSCCKQGLIGTFPALNAWDDVILEKWLQQISLKSKKDADFGINLIVHKTNKRLQGNLDAICKYKVPLVITSLGASSRVIDAVHAYGGKVFHDVTNIYHAKKAIDAGVDGLIAICAGAGGHAGLLSPFAFMSQLRALDFKGNIVLGGSITDGRGIRAAQALGADYAYMGTRFIATKESMASQEYKEMCISSKSGPAPSFLPIVYTSKISGVGANFLRDSLTKAGMDPDNPSELGKEDFSKLDAGQSETKGKAWKDIWSAGHGVLNMHDIPTVKMLVEVLEKEYQETVLHESSTIAKLC